MIWLAISLLAQPFPPAPSGRPLPPGAVEILDPIAPALARYEACVGDRLRAGIPVHLGDADGHRRMVDAAIQQCADVRRSAVAEADQALSRAPDYKDPAKRDLAIRHAFEGTEHVRRELGAMVRSGLLPGSGRPAAPAVRVPPRVMPAAVQYMKCMTAGTNSAGALADRDARRARAVALDAECRAGGLMALPKAVVGEVTSRNPAEVAALNKAMDEMGRAIIASFVGSGAPK
jgi:hypothetical protein